MKKNRDTTELPRRVGIMPKTSAVATAIASLLGTVHANMDSARHSTDAPASFGMEHVVPVSDGIVLPGLKLVIPESANPYSHRKQMLIESEIERAQRPLIVSGEVIHVEDEEPPEEVSIPVAAEIGQALMLEKNTTELDPIYMEWARLFSADPEADQTVREGVVQEAIASIIALNTGNTEVVEVSCQGTASDEDDFSDSNPDTTNPGFGIPSEKNVELATLRGATVVNEMAGPLTESLGNIPVVNQTGTEVENPALADAIFAIADAKGINPVTLVKQFNRGDFRDLTDEDLTVFHGLRDDRFVQCWVTTETTTLLPNTVTEKPIEPPTKPAQPSVMPEGGTVIVQRPGEHTVGDEKVAESKHEHKERNLILVLIPIPVPIIRRKLKGRLPGQIGSVPISPSSWLAGGATGAKNPLIYGKNNPRHYAATSHGDQLVHDSVLKAKKPTRGEKTINPRHKEVTGQTIGRRKQPRNHNYSKSPQHLGGNRGRSKGGNISGKRA